MTSRTEKGFFRLLAALLGVLILAGCSGAAGRSEAAAAEIAAAAAETYDGTLFSASPEDENFAATVERVYGIDPETVRDGSIYYADGVSASEIAVLQFAGAQDAAKAAEALQDYVSRREAAFTGYAPDQAEVAAGARVVQSGNTVLLLMLPDPQGAEQAAAPLLSGEISAATASAAATVSETPAPSPVETGYDHDAVLEALRSGSPDGLSPQNREIWQVVTDVIASEITGDMTPYEKEVAIHDWMTANIEYDPAELSHPLLGAVPTAENDNPIGALLSGRSICYGYSSTFQLFMDALGIPCITIDGEANYPAEAHSWNAVELDGQWYYVDVTWDDPTIGFPDHDYLNQTTAYLEEHGPHIWDREGLPEIAAEPYRAP